MFVFGPFQPVFGEISPAEPCDERYCNQQHYGMVGRQQPCRFRSPHVQRKQDEDITTGHDDEQA